MPTIKMKLTRAERKAGVDLRDVIKGRKAKNTKTLKKAMMREPKYNEPKKGDEKIVTFFGEISIKTVKTGCAVAFKLPDYLPEIEEDGDDAEEALTTLCDTLDTIAAEARTNVTAWLRANGLEKE